MINNWDGKERRMETEERRKVCYLHQETIDAIKADIKENQSAIHELETTKIPEAETFRGQAKIAGVIALAIIGTAFTYTYNHKQTAEGRFNRLEAKVDTNLSGVSAMEGNYKALLVRISGVVEEVKESNDYNKEFLEIIREERRIHPLPNNGGAQ